MTPQRVVHKVPGAHLLGGPQVVVDHRPSSVVIYILGSPWGWGDQRQEFLHRGKPGPVSERYAAKLIQRIGLAVMKEEERRERLKAAKQREREGGGS